MKIIKPNFWSENNIIVYILLPLTLITKVINYFKKKSKERIFFLIGSDNLIYFHKWRNYRSILKSCVLVVFSRKGYDNREKKSILLKKKDFNNIIFVNNKKFNISSTMIKRKLI